MNYEFNDNLSYTKSLSIILLPHRYETIHNIIIITHSCTMKCVPTIPVHNVRRRYAFMNEKRRTITNYEI